MSNKTPANPPPKQQKPTGAVPVARPPNAYDRLAAAGGSIAIAGAHVLPSPMSSVNNSATGSSSGALLNRFCAIFARCAALGICLLSPARVSPLLRRCSGLSRCVIPYLGLDSA
ncbi:hypothetical protein FRC10_004688 [Ceratobasidium sp. 414]|nr:hypothetical protein FRC10_004688 [Ceratobasidium sp. 414]